MGRTQAPVYADFPMQSAATTGNGTAIDLGAIDREVALYIVFSAGVTAGQITIETAHASGYGGTWQALDTINWVAADKVHLSPHSGVFRFIRARISDDIVGGTVTVLANAN